MAVDIMFGIFVLYGFYLGFTKGIIKTVFTVLSITLGLTAAFKFAPPATEFLETTFKSNNPLMFIAGFLLSFVLTMLLFRLIARGLEGMLRTANINIVNQILGGVVLAGLMVLVYSVILWFGDQASLIDKTTKEESITYPYLKPFPAQVRQFGERLQPMFNDFWDKSIDMMDRLKENTVEQSENTEIEDRSHELPPKDSPD